MAALDVVEVVGNGSQYSSAPGVTFGATPSNGQLLIVLVAPKTQDLTAAPAGFTLLGEGTFAPWLHVYGKVASGESGAGYSGTIGTADDWCSVGIRLAGPFTDLSTLTLDIAATSNYQNAQTVMATAATVAADTLVFAGINIAEDTRSFSSASNSFGTAYDQQSTGSKIQLVRRLYGSADAGVQTVITMSNGNYGWRFMLRVASPVTVRTLRPTLDLSNSGWLTP